MLVVLVADTVLEPKAGTVTSTSSEASSGATVSPAWAMPVRLQIIAVTANDRRNGTENLNSHYAIQSR